MIKKCLPLTNLSTHELDQGYSQEQVKRVLETFFSWVEALKQMILNKKYELFVAPQTRLFRGSDIS